ncbi:MAG: MerR family DNA-binding protein [Leptospirales bacterium]|nr:MerR family DNA-binding protein [Leptospirales bacterium]
MLISDLSRRTRISRHTIRYYEKLGLLQSGGRRENSYKEYGEDADYRLRFIHQVKRLGFSLAEIKDFLALLSHSTQKASQRIMPALQQKKSEIDSRIRELQTLKRELERLIRHCGNNPKKGAEQIKELVESMEERAPSLRS